jgi:hypothetical protein
MSDIGRRRFTALVGGAGVARSQSETRGPQRARTKLPTSKKLLAPVL